MARQDADKSEPPTASEPISEAPQSLRAPRTTDPTDPDHPPLTPRSLASDPTELDLKPPHSTSQPAAARKAGDPDTLISAPRPADREELEIRDRFRLLEDRIDELDARLRILAQRRPEQPLTRSQPWWIWLIFLLGLAITWKLLEAFR